MYVSSRERWQSSHHFRRRRRQMRRVKLLASAAPAAFSEVALLLRLLIRPVWEPELTENRPQGAMVKPCSHCGTARAVLRRPKTFEQLCRECFYAALEQEVHQTIVGARLFRPGERVALAASGGKDSTVLAHMLTTLNRRHG